MTKTPSRPKPTVALASTLLRHYNSQVDAYNAALTEMPEKKRPETGLQQKFMPEADADGSLGLAEWNLTRESLVLLIRRQNHRLKRHIKRRALDLLYTKVREADKSEVEGGDLQFDKGDERPLMLRDGKYTVGHTYQHILDILKDEFPEASTSVACLRWYVVHERSDAVDAGLPWPDLPQVRPRSNSIVKKAS